MINPLASSDHFARAATLLHPLDTPFNHLGENGNQGVLRQSGLYVTEQGKGGWVQQVDLRV
ncbi:hypothetical protein [Aeromonas hydrophila]|uniref:hypothetical protein n=1 Tax=Aeromonas hydrophila TaxID=644 RepID=UPI002B4A1F83|nr:hypothetical protein [Aeromonas hydrophila]